MSKVSEAQYIHLFELYKIGIHGFVYRWDGDKWMKSTIPAKEFLKYGKDSDQLIRVPEGGIKLSKLSATPTVYTEDVHVYNVHIKV